MGSTRMPVVFVGHGSPMIALDQSEETNALKALGREIVDKCGMPKGIIAVSGHWYTRGTWVQQSAQPEQIYDMYGFPAELYDVIYPAPGDKKLAEKAKNLLGAEAGLTEAHGVDHGVWTMLVHMFPEAGIPVVAVSVNGLATPSELYELGKRLAPLRDEGILILASGAIVHNLRAIDPADEVGSPETRAFMDDVVCRVKNRNDGTLIDYDKLPHAGYAVPTPDHYLPLLYALGASEGEPPRVFNNVPQLGSTALTSFVFGLDTAPESR